MAEPSLRRLGVGVCRSLRVSDLSAMRSVEKLPCGPRIEEPGASEGNHRLTGSGLQSWHVWVVTSPWTLSFAATKPVRTPLGWKRPIAPLDHPRGFDESRLSWDPRRSLRGPAREKDEAGGLPAPREVTEVSMASPDESG